jgi:putative FmdB family regulatory protein
VPLYEYQCPKCGRFELIRKFSDEPLTICPTCGNEIQKLASAPAFHLKGTGWYVTDYAKKSGAGASSEGNSGEGKSGESKSGESKSGDSKSGEKSGSGDSDKGARTNSSKGKDVSTAAPAATSKGGSKGGSTSGSGSST